MSLAVVSEYYPNFCILKMLNAMLLMPIYNNIGNKSRLDNYIVISLIYPFIKLLSMLLMYFLYKGLKRQLNSND